MKKNALILAITAVSAAPAAAVTLYDNADSGTKIEFNGSARIKWETEAVKTTAYDDGQPAGVSKEAKNRPVKNNGTRFGFKGRQSLGSDDVYALGRAEWRFRGRDNNGVDRPSNHDFDHLYTRQLYGGIGHQRYGELTYGNQTVITDKVKQTDLANTLSLSDGLLASAARRSIQYKYENKDQGIEAGVFYGGRSPRGNNGLNEARKDIIGAGAVKTFKVNGDDELNVGVGVSRERFKQEMPVDYFRDAYALGTAYTFGDTTVGLDVERRIRKDEGEAGYKRTNDEIRTAVYHKLNSDWRAYGMYAYKTEKRDQVSSADRKEKQHQFMIGTEYFLIPKSEPFYVKTFAEAQTTRSKAYRNGELRTKTRNYTTVVGLRAYW